MKRRMTTAVLGAAVLAALLVTAATAATTIVAPSNAGTLGWNQTDNRGAGSETWTNAFGAPDGLGSGALELKTGADTADKASIGTDAVAGTALSSVTSLGYWTDRAAGPDVAAASLQVTISLGEDCTDGNKNWTTLVYEPYWNTTSNTVPAAWTNWQITPTSGLFWSSKTTCDGKLVAGIGGAPFYTLEQVKEAYPNATLTGLGVNVGTYNPGYEVAVDGVSLNDTVYDFESPVCTPTGFVKDGINLTAAVFDPSGPVTGQVDASGCSIGVYYGPRTTAGSVDGAEIFGANYYGVVVNGGAADVTNSSIHDIGESPLNGAQHGVGVFYGATADGIPSSGTLSGTTITNYQKNGVAVDGAGTAVSVENNTVTGQGMIDWTAQNGIQISRGATALVTGNTVSGNWYTPKDTIACGLLFFEAAGVKQHDNTLFGNEINLCNAGRGGGNTSVD
jgi:hypothetical protein